MLFSNGLLCCVHYKAEHTTKHSEEDVYFVNADLVLVEKNEEVQPTFGLGMGK